MESEQIKTFCDSASQLLLRIAVPALAAADNVVRMTPMPMMPVPNVGAPS